MKKLSLLVIGVMLTQALMASDTFSFDDSIDFFTRRQIENDLVELSKLKGRETSNLYAYVFKAEKLNGLDLFNFFKARIKNFNTNDCGGGISLTACVRPDIDNETMWITQNFIKYDMPQIFRMSIFIHEARHTEKDSNYWFHEACPIPYLDANKKDIVGIMSGAKMEGQLSCDSTAVGAYGIQALFLKAVEKSCSNCNDKTKMDAALFGNDTINRISNLPNREFLKTITED